MDIRNKPDLKQARRRSKQPIITKEYQSNPTIQNLGVGKKFLIQTHGCQANEADSEILKAMILEQGFTQTDKVEDADLILINTCAVRETAENKVFGELGRLKSLKKINPDMILVVAGCMSQEEATVERILTKYKHVDIVLGTHNIPEFTNYLNYVMVEKKKMIEVVSEEGTIFEHLPKARDSRFKAWVNIMYGCDEFCTYCIVPYTRGKERSRRKEYIIKEVKTLVEMGYQEITLLGQNVNSYGLDFEGEDYSFADLLRDLSDLKIPRIRFTTSHPKDFSDDLIDVIALRENVMPHIHLPVQSGSNPVLKKMNRKYTKEQYLDLVDRIYKKIPDASITTDIIVGFPTETEADFQETMDLVRQAKFEGAYTFVYSPRKGTPAAKYETTVTNQEAKGRLYRLNELVNEGYLQGNIRFKDKIVKVLVEGLSKTKDNVFSGYTEHNKLVNVKCTEASVGKIIPVKITKVKTWSLDGEPVEENK
ncbi:MAG: tRNA (N6-isopentenyl adenosine(37)-C2)-methylthiotransferase MiaB [Bacilli bacterium]|nr:tRNA (N6-isopentenyl adenosine(37)-C2)-methylthiotransferase MiaB [Bacilli bacterium]MBN2877420.1 tRNA (N6-isopentenyl adenosine(37)-C2)-methylthiotransferase MiaB [Bacilli bacterium]